MLYHQNYFITNIQPKISINLAYARKCEKTT